MTDRHVSFTGSRRGEMPEPQADRVTEFLAGYCCIHHGDCFGRDRHAHQIARSLGMAVEVHPPIINAFRAHCAGDIIHPTRNYLHRNQAIVKAGEALVAAPAEMQEVRKGGTWQTVRYARQQAKPVVIVYPDGSFSLERFAGYKNAGR